MDIESKLMEILREFELKSKLSEGTTYHELYHGGAIPKIKQLVRESLPEKREYIKIDYEEVIPKKIFAISWQTAGFNEAIEEIKKVWGE